LELVVPPSRVEGKAKPEERRRLTCTSPFSLLFFFFFSFFSSSSFFFEMESPPMPELAETEDATR
jgi:hypothetical protein